MANKASSSVSKRQTATVERLRQIDSTLETHQVEDVVLVSYTPRWEKGRTTNGTYRENPNPTRLTHAVLPDGKLVGWGFGPVRVALPEGATITTAEDMASVLKERLESRKPAKVEAEPTPEVEVEKPKTTSKRATAKRSGVQVTS